MSSAEHSDLTDAERKLYTTTPVSDRTSRLLSWGLGIVFGGIVVFMVLAATVFKGADAPGLSYREMEALSVYEHQPPQSEDVRVERGSAAASPKDSAHRYIVRKYITKITPEQTRAFYLRQFGPYYAITDSHDWDTDQTWVLRGSVVMSERTTADPPNVAVRVAIGKEMYEERTQVTLSLESDY